MRLSEIVSTAYDFQMSIFLIRRVRIEERGRAKKIFMQGTLANPYHKVFEKSTINDVIYILADVWNKQ